MITANQRPMIIDKLSAFQPLSQYIKPYIETDYQSILNEG